jgi:hypothetical protein
MCPYGTYQRALASAKLSIAAAISDPAKFEAAMLTRLSKKGKKDEVFLKRFLASAREHLEKDFELMNIFRL